MAENDLPITTKLPVPSFFWSKPLVAEPLLYETVEPYASAFDELNDDIIATCGNDDRVLTPCLPDSDYWQPTPRMRALLVELERLRGLAHRWVPNPDYDPVKAEEWEHTRHENDAIIITVGQSYTERET